MVVLDVVEIDCVLFNVEVFDVEVFEDVVFEVEDDFDVIDVISGALEAVVALRVVKVGVGFEVVLVILRVESLQGHAL